MRCAHVFVMLATNSRALHVLVVLDYLHSFFLSLLPHLFWFIISTAQVMPGECFEIKLDVNRCKREDVTVEFVDNCLVVQTRKCQPDDNSIVARKFSKRVYPIEMSKYDKETLHYEFDQNGMLKIQILPKKPDDAAALLSRKRSYLSFYIRNWQLYIIV